MRIPRKLTPRLNAVAAVIAALAALAVAGGALAYRPAAPVEGQVVDARVVAVEPGGAAFAAWVRYSEAFRAYHRRAAVLDTGGRWQWADPDSAPPPPPTIDPLEPAWGLQRAFDRSGNGVAIWQGGTVMRAATRPAGGVFGVPEIISAPADAGRDSAVALGGGHAIALWTTTLPEMDPLSGAVTFERRQTRAADRLSDGSWSAPYDLGPPDAGRPPSNCACGPGPDLRPAVAVDSAGNAVAAWVSRLTAPGGSVLVWSARPAGGPWSEPALLAVDAVGVRLATGPSGEVLAAWVAGRRLRAAMRPPGGTFGDAEDVGPALGVEAASPLPSLTIDADGRALAVWRSSLTELLAATRAAGGAWSPPTFLTALGPTIVEPPIPKLSVRLRDVRISRDTLRQPACALRRDGRKRRACRTPSTALTFRLTAAAEVRVIVQRLGGGRALRGLRIRAGAGKHHIRLFASRPLPPGRYTVRIRVASHDQMPEEPSRQLVVRPA